MRTAIIIPAFNAATTLGETIRSVLAQSHADWRMVVVDDGSQDGSAAIAGVFGDRRIQVVRQANAGVSAARNRGLAELDADAFLFLDADDCLTPHALSALAGALTAEPEAVAASGGARFIGAGGRPGTRHPLPASGGAMLPGLLIRNRFANGGHLLLRRSAVRAEAGFRTDLHYGEDWEYVIRIALRGRFAAVAQPRTVLNVRERADGGYWRRAADPSALLPGFEAIFGNPALRARYSVPRLEAIRRRAEAENAWVVGRSLLVQGNVAAGRRWLRRSVAAAPTLTRLALLVALHVGRGPGRPAGSPA